MIMAPLKHAVLAPQIKDEYLAGASLEALAEKHGGAVGTIRNTLRRQGVTLRPPGKVAKPLSPTKVCSACGDDLPRSEFSRGGKRTSECKGCTNEKQNVRYRSDEGFRQRKIVAAKVTAERRPAAIRAYKRQWATNWTPERFVAAWEAQGGRCAICEVLMVDGGRGPTSVCADHDHQTGQPRKLLCRHCNLQLGIFEAHRAAFEKYLRETGVGLGV